jgi:type VI secretion system protein VasD
MYRLLQLLCLFALLSSCATTHKLTEPLQLNIAVAANANPDDRGRPSPVVVNIFDLNKPQRFRNADYLALLATPRKILRGDMLGVHRINAIAPGSERTLQLAVDAQANHIGIVAELVDFSSVDARATLALQSHRSNALNLSINANGITVTPDGNTESRLFSRFNDD